MSKEGQPGTDMIGLQDSVLASGQFCANYRTFGRSCLFNFPVNFIAYLYCLQMDHQDIGTYHVYLLCLCTSCDCLWRATEHGNK